MFDDDMDNDNYSIVEFAASGEMDGVRTNVSYVLNDKETYTDIVDQFRFFLNAIGYTYIGGLTVLDTNGEELYSTDL